MRLGRAWRAALVLVAVSLALTLHLVGAGPTSGVNELANTAVMDPAEGAREWSAFVALVFLAVGNLVALGRRQPNLRVETPKAATPWQRLVTARYSTD